MIVKAIAEAVHEAEQSKQKIAMFHYQVLIHAEELRGVDAVEFCKEIKVPTTYATEFRKMISLAELMKEQGATINTD
jgi:uncharacterized protein (DUF924 family)